ncbi:MAG: UDP-2,3-diacylglucosamine diphosphatase LpxI [Sedimentisphaerales bacterium]|nr:UDP-2,3-diacylglucosamine diphosphatase LpxI [Sedimentisphaerales bacterium]
MGQVLGLIAGGGLLPVTVARGARQGGCKVICVGLVDALHPALAENVDVLYRVSVARPGSWLRRFKRHGVRQAVIAGLVEKSGLLVPWRIVRYLPDWRMFRIYYWRLRKTDKQTDTILRALADELASGGVELIDSTRYCKDSLAKNGNLTSHRPPSQSDIEFGWQMAKRIGELDIGQAVTVKEQQVIAVEAMEGTAEMIKRTGQICKAKGWTLVKTAKPNQDMRFDVPCVGPDTIRQMAANGGACLVIEAGKTIILQMEQTLQLADRFGIAVVGMSRKG